MKLLDAAQKRYLDHMDTRAFPACFKGSRQFEEWQAVESIAHTKPRALPCRDCTNAYHSQMVKEGRCAVAGLPRITRIMTKD
jgi:hypothetical protein